MVEQSNGKNVNDNVLMEEADRSGKANVAECNENTGELEKVIQFADHKKKCDV